MEKELFLAALDHLAWCNRCCCEEDYKTRFIEYGMRDRGWDNEYATVLAYDTFKNINERGIIYAYQQYINVPEYLDVIEHSFNIRKR